MGGPFDPNAMWRIALTAALATAAATPDDPIAWFNLGSSAVGAGDFTQAADAFDRARTLGLPWRMFWYQFGAFEAYWRTGRYEDVIALADATLAGGAAIEEVHYWRGMALSSLGVRMKPAPPGRLRSNSTPIFSPPPKPWPGSAGPHRFYLRAATMSTRPNRLQLKRPRHHKVGAVDHGCQSITACMSANMASGSTSRWCAWAMADPACESRQHGIQRAGSLSVTPAWANRRRIRVGIRLHCS
ncbi:MAG: tetratricopeptide repeat protein [Caldilineaceae bacterium]